MNVLLSLSTDAFGTVAGGTVECQNRTARTGFLKWLETGKEMPKLPDFYENKAGK